MIPYYSPYFSFSDACGAIMVRHAATRIEAYYRALTGKKYILITASCRAALYLTYASISRRGKVLVSPLICSTALEPIVSSKNKVQFVDVSLESFNLNEGALPHDLSNDVIALQTTYFGGCPLDMERIVAYTREHKILLIEDCAQGFGSSYRGKALGSFGDVACFSMIKTAYGLSGGILATNDKGLYDRAAKIQATWRKPSKVLMIYRSVRNILETHRNNRLGEWLYNKLLQMRPKRNNEATFESNMVQPTEWMIQVCLQQNKRLEGLHNRRKKVATQICQKLPTGYYTNYGYMGEMVPTKLFVYSKDVQSKTDIERMNKSGIEAKHLQQKYAAYYQDSLRMKIWEEVVINDYPNFVELHEHIVSIPLREEMKEKEIEQIIKQLP